MVRIDFRSLLREETMMRWAFLESATDPCAVVTPRMELVYINAACQALVPAGWFSKRCFEVLPTHEKLCALDCPTILAVQTAHDITYCEEVLDLEDGSTANLGTAVIPLPQSDDGARALLLFRLKSEQGDAAAFARALLRDARRLSDRIEASA